MAHKQRDYLFYNTTSSICSTCLNRVEAKILIKNSDVFLEKWCPEHGVQRVLISDDASYYRWCREVFVKTPEMPERFNTSMKHGCPFDCGLCPDHMQHSCLSILEITQGCNLTCPTCYANSSIDKQNTMLSLEDVDKMLETIIKNEITADVVQISGGEPTTHPKIFEIIELCRKKPILHLMLNTNGIKIANDEECVKKLSSYKKGFEVYLQFDGLSDNVYRVLRGQELLDIKLKALENLEKYNISTTLVMTVVDGINLEQIGDIIEFAARKYKCIRGVTLQPVSLSGRFDKETKPLLLSTIRTQIAKQSSVFKLEDILPVPCNPDSVAMAYALKIENELTPVTRHVTPDMLLGGANTIVFEHDKKLKDSIIKLLATNLSPDDQASCLTQLLCCLPKFIFNKELTYENIFRVMIVDFMDKNNLDIRALKKSCIHIVTNDDKLIPFESYNIFYRKKYFGDK